jgi:hypothetical protein
LAAGGDEGQCGNAGPFLLEVGISSSHHIATFFGIADARLRTSSETHDTKAAPHTSNAAMPARGTLEPVQRNVLYGEIIDKDDDAGPRHANTPPPAGGVGAVINRALTAAGLLKGG